MQNPAPTPRRIPNGLLLVFALSVGGAGTWLLVRGDREGATGAFASAGIALGLLDFDYARLPRATRLVVTPVLLAPFAVVLGLLLYGWVSPA